MARRLAARVGHAVQNSLFLPVADEGLRRVHPGLALVVEGHRLGGNDRSTPSLLLKVRW